MSETVGNHFKCWSVKYFLKFYKQRVKKCTLQIKDTKAEHYSSLEKPIILNWLSEMDKCSSIFQCTDINIDL